MGATESGRLHADAATCSPGRRATSRLKGLLSPPMLSFQRHCIAILPSTDHPSTLPFAPAYSFSYGGHAQTAYTCLEFSPVLWPEFSSWELFKCFFSFQRHHSHLTVGYHLLPPPHIPSKICILIKG